MEHITLPTNSKSKSWELLFYGKGSEGKAFVYLQSEKKAKAVQAVTTGLDLFFFFFTNTNRTLQKG